MPRITVEHGGRFVHCSHSQLRVVLAELSGAPANLDVSVLAAAAVAANSALSQLSTLVRLHGRASKNLGTALRVYEIRSVLSGTTTASGDALLDELRHIAAAADAARHLSLHSIQSATVALQGLVDSQAPPLEGAGSRCHMTPKRSSPTTVSF